MSTIQLSKTEQEYIINGIHFEHRIDGRKLLDYRDIQIEPSVLRGTHGSSRIRLGDTEILCGISVELYKIESNKTLDERSTDSNTQNQKPKISDLLHFSLECSPNASPDFQGRGGEKTAEEISNLLLKSWTNNSKLVSALQIIENKYYWRVYIDLLVLECGGTLLDAASLACLTALRTTIFPRTEVEEGDEFQPVILLVDDKMSGVKITETDFNSCLDEAPIIITIHKIGHSHIVDPSLEEECCSSAAIRVALSNKSYKNGNFLMMVKSGNKSLAPTSIKEMMIAAQDCFEALDKELNRVYQNRKMVDLDMVSSEGAVGYMIE